MDKVTVRFKSRYPLDLKQLKVYGGLFHRVNAKKEIYVMFTENALDYRNEISFLKERFVIMPENKTIFNVYL